MNDILDRTDSFLDFWFDYIKAENYYLTFFEKSGQQKLFSEDEILFVEKYKILFFDDITQLIKSFKNKLEIEGYINISDKKEKEKRATEITYAYIIQFILFKTLVDNKFDDFEEEFEEICLNIYNFIKAKNFKNILGILDSISAKISSPIYLP